MEKGNVGGWGSRNVAKGSGGTEGQNGQKADIMTL